MVNKTARKKKRVSKHVLKANQISKKAVDPSNDVEAFPRNDDSEEKLLSKSTMSSKKSKTKDPNDAASYLSAWKHRESGANWKFNKNTQSWFIRHMYEADKVSKSTFGLLLEYVNGLHANSKGRILQVAEQRALRYKRFEKALEKKSEEVVGDSTAEGTLQSENTAESPSGSSDIENARWMQLDEHSKRKEYKRARKILEILK
jgi:WKF domain